MTKPTPAQLAIEAASQPNAIITPEQAFALEREGWLRRDPFVKAGWSWTVAGGKALDEARARRGTP